MIWIKFLFILELFVKVNGTINVFQSLTSILNPPIFDSFKGGFSGKRPNSGKPSYKPPSGGKPSYKPTNNGGQNKPSYKPTNNGGQNKPSYKPSSGGNGGGRPSYKPPNGGAGGKPSYKPPNRGRPGSNGGKPSYKPSNSGNGSKPSYRAPGNNQINSSGNRKPSYQNNLQAPPAVQTPSQSPSSSPPNSYQTQSGNGNNISDQEMKQLLVNIHEMMKQIVATQQTNTVLASVALQAGSSASAPDSYGNPLGSPISSSSSSSSSASTPVNSAPDSYGNPVAQPISTSVASSPSSSSVSASSASNSYNSPGSSTAVNDDPVILSTYQQLSTVLRQLRQAQIDERDTQIEDISQQESVKKPVVFPTKPSFMDIIRVLEQKNREKRKVKNRQRLEERIDDSNLPELTVDSFF